MFDKILIANRGEIAVRVARTCREMGIGVVAVHSTDDASSAVVGLADETVQIGPGPAQHSYLSIPALIEAAHRTGADAIHPGYGFLSEDADFAEVCEDHGIVFIGPPSPVIARLGDKTGARQLMSEAGVPMLPGSLAPLRSVAEAHALADDIGYPVIVKAAAGGGGRGMRVVEDSVRFAAAYEQTRATAQSLFGDPRVYVEQFLPEARHVEVQVLADAFGAVVHLGARDCSVQRRHQKLVEECPPPGLPSGLVREICAVAAAGMKYAGYVGAGTVEFLVAPDRRFSFMEVNCRIQVEHPVTEMVTGLDLVREQIRIAAGEQLGLGQDDVSSHGAAIECRVNTEDPDRDFVPAPGVLERFNPPGGPFVRVDTHGFPGYRVPAAYDSLLAKVVVWAPDRDQALRRMDRALAEFTISGRGVRTTTRFLRDVVTHEQFRTARHSTATATQVVEERARRDRGAPPAASPSARLHPSNPSGG